MSGIWCNTCGNPIELSAFGCPRCHGVVEQKSKAALKEVKQIILNLTQSTCKCLVCIEFRAWMEKYKDILENG